MSSGHTPGPWFLTEHGIQVLAQIAHDRCVPVCRVTISIEGHEANSRLIAAAPDLLDACQSARAWLGEKRTGEWPYDIAINEVIDQLDAAIAATGQGGIRP